MAFLTDDDRSRIEAAIAKAEARSSGELVAVVARAASSYRTVAILWPALLTLIMPAILLTVRPATTAWHLYLAQTILFVGLGAVVHVPAVRLALVPRTVKRHAARKLARLQFIEQGLHLTTGRTGVLIFVSIAEHHVEILADAGIDQVVAPGTWDRAVATFVGQVRAGNVATGFLTIIEQIGDRLAQHFPRAENDVNERPNHLVEI